MTRIELIFSLGDSQATPWVNLCLDANPNSDAGDGYTHPDFAKLEFKKWLAGVQTICDGRKAVVITTDGKRRRFGDVDGALTQAVGKLLVSALLSARDDGTFNTLPRAERCHLGVEDPTTGEFGWPRYEDRGKKDLV